MIIFSSFLFIPFLFLMISACRSFVLSIVMPPLLSFLIFLLLSGRDWGPQTFYIESLDFNYLTIFYWHISLFTLILFLIVPYLRRAVSR